MMSDMLQLVVVLPWKPFGLVSDKLKHVGQKAMRRLDSGLVRCARAQVPYLNVHEFLHVRNFYTVHN